MEDEKDRDDQEIHDTEEPKAPGTLGSTEGPGSPEPPPPDPGSTEGPGEPV